MIEIVDVMIISKKDVIVCCERSQCVSVDCLISSSAIDHLQSEILETEASHVVSIAQAVESAAAVSGFSGSSE
jgi:hypothetical protein